jgi:hypothetical protein
MKLGALVFGALVVGFASHVSAQTTIVVPNAGGGFTAFGPIGDTYIGVPNGAGGGAVFGPRGQTTIIVPDAGGGYTQFGPGYPGGSGFDDY